MTSWSEIRSTCSSTASSFSASHASTILRAAGSPWNSVTRSSLSATGLERRDHLGAVEDDVAGPHVELVDNRFAQVEEQVVLRGQHELPTEFGLVDFLQAVLHSPHHGPLPAGEEALHQPSLGLELPQSQTGLAHVVLEARV